MVDCWQFGLVVWNHYLIRKGNMNKRETRENNSQNYSLFSNKSLYNIPETPAECGGAVLFGATVASPNMGRWILTLHVCLRWTGLSDSSITHTYWSQTNCNSRPSLGQINTVQLEWRSSWISEICRQSRVPPESRGLSSCSTLKSQRIELNHHAYLLGQKGLTKNG